MHLDVICRCPDLHHGAHSCLILLSLTPAVFFASEYVEDGGQYEVPEHMPVMLVYQLGLRRPLALASIPPDDCGARSQAVIQLPVPMPITSASRKMSSQMSLSLVTTCVTDLGPALFKSSAEHEVMHF